MKFQSNLLHNENGQATTEYILMVAIVVGFVLFFVRTFIRPAYAKLRKALSANINNALFGADFHRFNIKTK